MFNRIVALQTGPTTKLEKFYEKIKVWLSKGLGMPGFKGWLTEAGMGWQGKEEWWIRNFNSERTIPHNGVDFCWYDGQKVIEEMGGKTVPMITDGTLVAIKSDFLGFSYIVKTSFRDSQGRSLHIAYAHAALAKGRTLSVGDQIQKDDPVLAITTSKTSCPSHLHVSTIWVADNYDWNQFDWNTVNNPGSVVEFVNPLPDDIRFGAYTPSPNIATLTIIGERLNFGFPATKTLMDAENHDELAALAVKQVKQGAKFLTINVGTDAIDRLEFLEEHIRRVQQAVFDAGYPVPLAFDSQDPVVLRACLETFDTMLANMEKPIVNSVNEPTLAKLDASEHNLSWANLDALLKAQQALSYCNYDVRPSGRREHTVQRFKSGYRGNHSQGD